MPKLRNAQFYRNTSITAYLSYDAAVSAIKTTFEAHKSNLKDGEFILGRYSYPKGHSTADGIIIGVARRVEGTITLDFLADETYVTQAIAALSTQETLVSVSENQGGGVSYDLTSELIQDNGLIISSGVTTLTFGTYPTADNPIVTYTDIQGIVSAMVYKGTVSSNSDLPTLQTDPDVRPGWVYVVAANGTYADVACEVGDMIIVKSVNTNNNAIRPIQYNIVSGENQYEFPGAEVVVNNGLTTIGTIDGAAIQIEVTADYSDIDNTPAIRTMNGEVLAETEVAKGDINIHDGYYFPNAVQDYDGNWYGAVVIGTQVWLRENLKATKYYENGQVSDLNYQGTGYAPGDVTTPSYYDVANASNVSSLLSPQSMWGYQYNWYAGQKKMINDSHWSTPAANDYEILRIYLESQLRHQYEGWDKYTCKSLAFGDYWPANNTQGTPGCEQSRNNSTGFSAVPTGAFDSNGLGHSNWCYLMTRDGSGSNQTNYCIQGDTANGYGGAGVTFFVETGTTKTDTRVIRCVCDMDPVQFRNWYVQKYGSMQHHPISTVATSGSYDDLENLPAFRTINGENIVTTPELAFDMNIHDGYYFPNAVQDYDNNWYGAVVIGTQVWLGENLRSKSYSTHGQMAQGMISGDSRISTITPYYYALRGVNIDSDDCGLLYNHPVIDVSMLKNESIWHMANSDDVFQLGLYLTRQQRHRAGDTASNIACSVAATKYWSSSNTAYTPGNDMPLNNSSGFNAVPAGEMTPRNGMSTFSEQYAKAIFWIKDAKAAGRATDENNYVLYITNDEKGFRYQTNAMSQALNMRTYDADYGLSIRYVSSLTPTQFRDWYVNEYGSMQHHVVSAKDSTISDDGHYYEATDVEEALQEIATRVNNVNTTSVKSGDGIVINSQTSGSVTISTVNINLGQHSTLGTTIEYNSNVDNLLIIATDGKLSISDTWDCGTY